MRSIIAFNFFQFITAIEASLPLNTASNDKLMKSLPNGPSNSHSVLLNLAHRSAPPLKQPFDVSNQASVLMGPMGGQMISSQERLYQRVISNEQLTRPDLTDRPINVTVRIMLIKLQDLVEKSELMETTVRVQIGWKDKRLIWNPSEYNGITEILLPSTAVWIPDLAVINSVSDVYSVVRDTRFEIKVENDGQLWWHPTGVLRTFCKLRLSYFPFDRQRCSVIVESPTFDRRFLHLRLRAERTPVDLRMYVESETWRLDKAFGTSQEIKAGVSTYFSRIEFWLVLERARLYHSINFILPCFILSAIQTVFFFLPATHPQRVGSTTVTMLSVMVFQSMVVAQLPKTSESVPLLSIYIDLVILVSATSVCASIFTALCNFHNDRQISVPKWLRACCGWRRRPCSQRKDTESPQPPTPPSPESYSRRTSSMRLRRTQTSGGETIPLHRPSPIPEIPPLIIEPRGARSLSAFATRDHPSEMSSRSPRLTDCGRSSTVDDPINEPLGTRMPRSPQQGLLGHRDSMISNQSSGSSSLLRRPSTDVPRRLSMRAEGFTVLQIPPQTPRMSVPQNRLPTCSEEKMSIYSNPTIVLPVGCDEVDSDELTWLDVLNCINYTLGNICALAISLGPAIIFGVVPSIADHQDFPTPIGDNFALLTNTQRH